MFNKFEGKPEEYLEWAAKEGKFNPQWCPRHWMPCPVEGKNGMLASVLMLTESFALVPAGVTTPSQLNSWWENQTVPACCQFGDEKMEKLWEVVDRISNSEVTCLEPPPDKMGFKGRHSCFYGKGHSGPHEWAYPTQSIFEDVE